MVAIAKLPLEVTVVVVEPRVRAVTVSGKILNVVAVDLKLPPLTVRSPAAVVFPEAAITENLFTLIAKLPVTSIDPAKALFPVPSISNTPSEWVLPVAESTVNFVVAIVRLPLRETEVPLICWVWFTTALKFVTPDTVPPVKLNFRLLRSVNEVKMVVGFVSAEDSPPPIVV